MEDDDDHDDDGDDHDMDGEHDDDHEGESSKAGEKPVKKVGLTAFRSALLLQMSCSPLQQ